MPIRLEGMTLYTVKDIEELLGIGNSTVRRYISDGRLRGRKVARRWYIPAENLLQFFNDSEQTPPPELVERLKTLEQMLADKENKPEPVPLIKRGRPPKKKPLEAAFVPASEPEPARVRAKTRKPAARPARPEPEYEEALPEPVYTPPTPAHVVVEVRAVEPAPPAAPPDPVTAPPPAPEAPVTTPPPQLVEPLLPAPVLHPVRVEPEPYIPPPPPPAILRSENAASALPGETEKAELEQLLEQARRLKEEAERLERIYKPEDH